MTTIVVVTMIAIVTRVQKTVIATIMTMKMGKIKGILAMMNVAAILQRVYVTVMVTAAPMAASAMARISVIIRRI